jgi:hypothetical protein
VQQRVNEGHSGLIIGLSILYKICFIINYHEKTPVPNVIESLNNLANILQPKTVCEEVITPV